ncbi:MAG: hypothetical protein MK085_10720, partial [Phycisphaerales bacterium]|nr:hypothetical protein [Phycisphaerales bacterium]
QNELDTRPIIARLLEVDAWREQYLEHVRELALVELDWENLGRRVGHWRELIVEDVDRDPFMGGRDRFLQNLDGPGNSLKANTRQRRDFLLNHDELQTEETES